MSLAVLARKTKTKRRMKSNKKAFILNMTGRGHVIGQSAKYSGCRQCGRPTWHPHGSTCKCAGSSNGVRQNCCQADKIVPLECRGPTGCTARWFQGLSQPAPQMGYGVYNNRISGGGYYPGNTTQGPRTGRTSTAPGKSHKYRGKPVWKQMPNYSASTIIAKNKAATLNQNRHIALKAPISACKAQKDASDNIVHLPGCCNPEGKNVQPHGCCRGVKIKPRLGYTRINHGWCQSTKGNPIGLPASYQIDRNKARAMDCICNTGFECCPCGCGSGFKCREGDTTLKVLYDGQGETLTLTSGPRVLNRCAKYTIDVTQAAAAGPAIITVDPASIPTTEWQDGDWMEKPANRCYVLWRHGQVPDKGVGSFTIPPPTCKYGGFDKIYIVDGQNHHTEVRHITLNVSPCYPGTSFKLPMSNKCGRVRSFFGV